MTPKQREQSGSVADQKNRRPLSTSLSSTPRRILIAGFVATISLAFPLAAAYSDECDRSPTTVDKAACETARLRAMQAKVQQQFGSLMTDAGDISFRTNIQMNQNIWTAYVESQCELEGDLTFGSAVAWVVPKCKVEAYQARLSFLVFVAETLKANNQ